jgi:hypothetical protein
MTAGLAVDYSVAKAKVAHARRHLAALQAQTELVRKEHKPYSLRWGQLDKKTGWISVYLVSEPVPPNDLGLYVGDVAHNLRCALDCIAVALAAASRAPIKNQQFPIYDCPIRYESDLGTPSEPKGKNRLLSGITDRRALELIASVQPYQRDGDAHADPLWYIYSFSNAQKRGQVSCDLSKLKRVGLDVRSGTVAEVRKNPKPPAWPPEPEYEFRGLRFARPFPTKFEVEGSIVTSPRFVITGGDDRGESQLSLAMSPAALSECCDRTGAVIDMFEGL